MDLINRLKAATQTAEQENDLPDFLAARIYVLASKLKDRNQLQVELELLIDQLLLYDTYGQTGYLGMGVNHHVLEATLARIEKKLSAILQGNKETL